MADQFAAVAFLGCAVAVLALGHHRKRKSSLCVPCDEDEVEPGAKASLSPLAARQLDARTPDVPTPRAAMLGLNPRAVGLSKDDTSNLRRENYIDWDDYFMSVAMLSAFRSKDPNRQVGACIVESKTKRIVGIGYNGFPWGCSDDALPWAREGEDYWHDTKYPYVRPLPSQSSRPCSTDHVAHTSNHRAMLLPCRRCATQR